MMMPTMRNMTQMPPEDDGDPCPQACFEDEIETEISFTLLSDENFQKAWNIWPVPPNRTKYDAVFMDLYFTSFNTVVKLVLNRCPFQRTLLTD